MKAKGKEVISVDSHEILKNDELPVKVKPNAVHSCSTCDIQ